MAKSSQMARRNAKALFRHHRWALSVRRLIVLVLVVGAGLGLIVHRVKVQREAVAAIEAVGGNVTYSWDWDYSKEETYVRGYDSFHRGWIEWVGPKLGWDYVGHPVEVWFDPRINSSQVDIILSHASKLRRLRSIRNMRLATDEGFSHIAGLRDLRRLDLTGYEIASATGASLAHLRNLRKLRFIEQLFVPATDDELAVLRSLPNLEQLELSSELMTDKGLSHLAGLTELRELLLWGDNLTSAGLSNLRGLKRLTKLRIEGTSIHKIDAIDHMHSLEYLSFYRSEEVDDDALAVVARLRSLVSLDLEDTHVTKAGVERLRRIRPEIDIQSNFTFQ